MGFQTLNQPRNAVALSDAALAAIAPSIFAAEPHASRSERYLYVPTVDILNGMRRAGFMPFSVKQGKSRDENKREFTKHMIRFRHSDATADRTGLFPEVVLINSHDGSSSYRLMAGIFRAICENGLIIGDKQDEVRVQHSGKILDKVVEGSYRVIETSQKTLAVVDEWSRIQLNSTEQLAFAEAARVVRFGDSEGEVTTPIQARQLLGVRRSEDEGADLWRTFNRVQENALQGGLTARNNNGRRISSRTVNGIDADVKLNKALWVLAEALAAAKLAA